MKNWQVLDMLTIRSAVAREDLRHVQRLFEGYAKEWPGPDLLTENFAAELASLPGFFAPPEGCLLLALYDDRPAGCVALRKLDGGVCEIKRLYVSLLFRGLGIGRVLAATIVEEARKIGYSIIRLDTTPAMESARKLYTSLGFGQIPSYNEKSEVDTIFMELRLK